MPQSQSENAASERVDSNQPSEPCGPFTVSGLDSTGTSRLANWLRSTHLPWGAPVHLTVVVAAESPWPPDDRERFFQSDVWIQGSADRATRITWEQWPAVAEIDPNVSRATLWLSPAALEALDDGLRSFLLVLLALLLRRQGWYHIHGAALQDRQGRGWLLSGNSGCGKSTTTALLAQHGWRVATDDIGFVTVQGGVARVYGARAHIALREGGRALLGRADGVPLAARRKHGLLPDELGSTWVDGVTPTVLAFPALGEKTALSPCAPRRAISTLVMWSHWMLYEPMFAQPHLDALALLGAQARCFDLTLAPDLFDHPHLLEELLS